MIFHDISKPKTKKKLSHIILGHDFRGSHFFEQFAGIITVTCLILFIITGFTIAKRGIHLKKEIADSANSGFESIMQAANEFQQSRFEQAKEIFTQAEKTFAEIQNTAWFTSRSTAGAALHDPAFESAQALIDTGTRLSRAGALFAQISSKLSFLPKQFFERNKLPVSLDLPSLTDQIQEQVPIFSQAVTEISAASAAMKRIPDSFIESGLRDRFDFAQNAVNTLHGLISSLEKDLPAILTLLGGKEPHTFLILLQNNAELRPSGGFIGNYMIVETNEGYITKTQVFDVYKADHQLTEKITPPPEIAVVNERWFMRDSNYSGHFPLSAAKAAWFLEKENGPGVDTVIAIDQKTIADLFSLTGPLTIPELSRPLTAENFAHILSYIIESKLTGRTEPKAILQSVIAQFQKSLFSYVEPKTLLPLLQQAIQSKHLLAYSKNEAVEDFFTRHKLAGLLTTPLRNQDYLAIIHTSVSGNKSDTYIDEKIQHDSYLERNGSVVNELFITRTHTWTRAQEERLINLVASFGLPKPSEQVLQILGRSRNTHMLRIYVPKGSVLLDSEAPLGEAFAPNKVSTQYDSELDATYFSAQMMVPDGEERTLRIKYRLPFELDIDPVDEYKLTVQKQPGQDNITFKKRILPGIKIQSYATFPKNGTFDADGVWQHESKLQSDAAFSSVWGK